LPIASFCNTLIQMRMMTLASTDWPSDRDYLLAKLGNTTWINVKWGEITW
jgi:hypothetical protein